MYRIRQASPADLPEIHRMQDIPERESILTSPLLPLNEFCAHAEVEMKAKSQYYCLLESDHISQGFLWIDVPLETCEIWGRHLRTLFHACAWFAFEILKMPRLKWCVRQSNLRFLKVCDLFQIRKTGDAFIWNISEKFEHIAVGNINYYELTSDEYFERIPLLEKYSMGSSIFLEETDDNRCINAGSEFKSGGV